MLIRGLSVAYAIALLACDASPSNFAVRAKAPKKHAPAKVQAEQSNPPVAESQDESQAESQDDLVDLASVLPNIELDLRYAGTDNFTGQALYAKARCLLRRPVAKAVQRAQQLLAAKGMQLLVWDCYRPLSVQETLWKLVPNPRFVARPTRATRTMPAKGSKHNRGAALDLSLLTLEGEHLAMPTDHDDFSPRARQNAQGISPEISARVKELRTIMELAGFTAIQSEWWHFDHKSWQQYELSDQPL